MKSIKLAVLTGVAAMAFTAAAPAEASWYYNNRGTWGGWGSSGWGSSGWGSSGWGSSGWGSSGWGSSGWGSSGWGSSSYGGSTSTSSGSTSTGGSTSSGGSSTGGTQVPEPSNLLMLSLGLAGLVAGRYAARRRRKKIEN